MSRLEINAAWMNADTMEDGTPGTDSEVDDRRGQLVRTTIAARITREARDTAKFRGYRTAWAGRRDGSIITPK